MKKRIYHFCRGISMLMLLLMVPFLLHAQLNEFVEHFDQLPLSSKWGQKDCTGDCPNIISTPVRAGSGAIKFTVQPGVISSNGNRSELTLTTNHPEGSERWFAWSFMVPTNYQDRGDDGKQKFEVIGQWHDQPDFSIGQDWNNMPTYGANIMMEYFYENGKSNIHLLHGIETKPGVTLDGKTYLPKVAAVSQIQKGVWYNVVIRVLYHRDETKGFVEAWLNGQPWTNGKKYARNMTNRLPLYFKMGLYRDRNWSVANSMIFDEFKISASSLISTNQPPVVSVSSPAGGSIYQVSQAVSVTASASDADGSIQNVTFYANGQLIGSDARAPYNVNWTPTVTGNYQLTAKATDDKGAATTSGAVAVTVNTTPACLAVVASGDDGAGSVAANVLDKDLSTRWSGEGNGAWIQFCLGESAKAVNAIDLAFFKGNERIYTFDVLVSEDASSWKTVATDIKSSGASLEAEHFTFTTSTAKYLRIVGHGNNVNLWNSYTEAKVVEAPFAPCVPVAASGDDSAGSVAENAIDGDLTTRWSGYGDGAWIQFCLGETATSVRGVEMAFHQGDARIATFDIALSLDGVSWTSVATNLKSSGNSLQLQSFSFPAREARFVKIIGHGNDLNLWNSYTEVQITTGTAPLEPVTLISWNDSWRYLDTGTDEGSGWRVVGGAGTETWKSGAAPLGYNNGDEATVVSYGPKASSKYTTTYFYKEVSLDASATKREYELKLRVDDGAVIYVNGVEQHRINMPSGAISYSTFSSTAAPDDGKDVHTISLAGAAFKTGTNRIAVEVHQQSPGSSDLTFDLQLIGLGTDGGSDHDLPGTGGPATLTRGPYLQLGTPTSLVVRWRTDVNTNSVVWYGTSPSQLNKVASVSTSTKEHEVKLTGLQPNTKYYYAIGSTTQKLEGDSKNYFITAPAVGSTKKTRIWVTGDCGNNSTNQRRVRDEYIKYVGSRNTDLWLLLGDNAYDQGFDHEYQERFFNVYNDKMLKQTMLYPAPGNHDYSYNSDRQYDHQIPYYNIFNLPTQGEAGGVPSGTEAYYSYDYANIHFVSLDSYGYQTKNGRTYALSDTLGPQVEWLKRDLAANKQKWTIVYWHHPPYSKGSHDSDAERHLAKLRERLVPILERYKVDMVLCGHSHSYERSKLMRGHFGTQNTFNPSVHNLSNSSGKNDGSSNSSPYVKNSSSSYKGTVYVVAGSAGKVSRGRTDAEDSYGDGFPHDALPFGFDNIGGSLVLEVEGNRLDAKWVCSDGVIRDQFTMLKDIPATTISNSSLEDAFVKAGGLEEQAGALAVYPNPFFSETVLEYHLEKDTKVKLALYNSKGERVKVLYEGKEKAGSHQYKLNAKEDRLEAGAYMVRLVTNEGQVTERVLYLSK